MFQSEEQLVSLRDVSCGRFEAAIELACILGRGHRPEKFHRIERDLSKPKPGKEPDWDFPEVGQLKRDDSSVAGIDNGRCRDV